MKKTFVLIFVLFLVGCKKETIHIDGFDEEVWKQDPYGCKDNRNSLVEALLNNKEELLGKNSSSIFRFLGRPDKTELYTRNQKFYHYYITPGHECGEEFLNQEHDRLTLRFSATDLLKEVSVYN